MKKFIIFTVIIILAGLGYFLLVPLFFDKSVHESFPSAENEEITQSRENISDQPKPKAETDPVIIAKGTFSGQANHRASGTVSLIKSGGKNFIRLEDDFDVENGPDLFVHLGKDGKYDPKASLGILKGNIGSQNYEIPESIKIEEYGEVWIWCRTFSVPFAQALIAPRQ